MGLREVAGVLGGIAAVVVLWSAWVSHREGEDPAARRLRWMAGGVTLWATGAWILPGWGGWVLAAGLGSMVALGLFLLIPLPGRRIVALGSPRPGVDERDIMFSRAELVPGTERFQDYYRRRPESRVKDDLFRQEAGLLAPGSTQYHQAGFAAADAAFWTIEKMRPLVEGSGGGERGAGPSPPATPETRDPAALTRFLKGWILKLGAHSVGVAKVRDYHLYTHSGRGDAYGRAVDLDHPFALALTVEMDREMVSSAPRSPTVMESARQYLRSGVMAIQVAELIRRLGYRARAHVDGNYRVICPLVARDAGLGEIGRMGLLMTPRLGPRVRIAVVTTDLLLVEDVPEPDPATLEFCAVCRKCASACPARALPLGDPEEDENGVIRWRVDAEACFTLWTRLGTDCARCMAVCPYSHPDNLLHNLVRRGVRRNAAFRRGAVWLDDLIYGRKPPPRSLPEWMDDVEAGRGNLRTQSGGDA